MVAARRRGLLARRQDRAARRLRHVLGAVELPRRPARPTTARSGSRRHHADDRVRTGSGPTVTLDNPFPNGLVQPSGNSLGALAGVGTSVSTSTRTEARRACSSTRWTSSASCPAIMVASSATSDRAAITCGLGGTNDAAVNINQLDPKYLALGVGAHAAACRTRSSASPDAGAAGDAGDRPAARSCCARSRSSRTSTRGRSPKARTATTPASSRWSSGVTAAGAAASATPTAC